MTERRQVFPAIFLWLISLVPLCALDPDQPAGQYVLEEWTSAQGLPSNNAGALSQTPMGYLWITTGAGPARFDGVKFSEFPGEIPGTGENRHASMGYIKTLFVDKEGDLWIGCEQGISRYHEGNGQFQELPRKGKWNRSQSPCFFQDRRGNIWIGFTDGRVSRNRQGRVTWFTMPGTGPEYDIVSIAQDREGNILAGTHKKGIYILRGDIFQPYDLMGMKCKLSKIYLGRDGSLWIGTNKGVLRSRDGKREWLTAGQGLSNENVTDIYEDSDGNLWVGTLNGLNRLQPGNSGEIIIETILVGRIVTRIFEDREKGLWISTGESGIKRLKDAAFTPHVSSYGKKGGEEIMVSIFEDPRGDIWMGSQYGNVYRYRGDRCVESLKIPIASNTYVVAIELDGKGGLWLGTCEHGLFLRKDGAFRNFTTRDGLAHNEISSIFKDTRGDIWVTTVGGLSRYKNGTLESFKDRFPILGQHMANIYEDKDHNIWICCIKGLIRLQGGRVEEPAMKVFLEGIPIINIHPDHISQNGNQPTFWIGTHGHGLARFEVGGNTFFYTGEHGIDSLYIYRVLKDEFENLWLMSEKGVLRVNNNELNGLAQGRFEQVNCTCFGVSDGLRSRFFWNVYSNNLAQKCRSGKLWLITKKGISIVNPARVRTNRFPPPVVIEKAVMAGGDREVPIDMGSREAGDAQDINFRFTSPTFLSPGKVRFKYKLEGFDDDWIFLPPGAERSARYRDLPPGDYTFRVSACNRDGIWNEVGAAFNFLLGPRSQGSSLLLVIPGLLFALLLPPGYILFKKGLLRRNGKYKNSSLHPDFARECIKKLTYLMDIDKLYRDEGITLQSLSEKLGVSSHQLSQLLNENLKKNFAEFINGYRVEETKKLLSDPGQADRKILAIAFDVGFNTKPAFNTAFKKHTGMTPSQYRKVHAGP